MMRPQYGLQGINRQRLDSWTQCRRESFVLRRAMDDEAACAASGNRFGKARKRLCHGGHHGSRGFRFNEPDAPIPYGENEIHLQPLLIAEIVQLLSPAGIDLPFDEFGGHKALEEGSKKRGPIQYPFRFKTKQVARQT